MSRGNFRLSARSPSPERFFHTFRAPVETDPLRNRRLRLIMPMRDRGGVEHRFAPDLRNRTPIGR